MISTYFGLPGSGKTTFLAKLAQNYKNKYKYIYSNVMLTNARYISSDDLMNLGVITLPENSLLLIDEAGIDFNNRSYKSMPKHMIYFLKMHRHYKIDIVFFSQSHEDCDITIRRLSARYFRVKKVGPFTLARKIQSVFTIDKETKEIIEGFEFVPFVWSILSGVMPFQVCFRPKYYKYFNSWDRVDLPIYR